MKSQRQLLPLVCCRDYSEFQFSQVFRQKKVDGEGLDINKGDSSKSQYLIHTASSETEATSSQIPDFVNNLLVLGQANSSSNQ
jgi:hypothetical protein